MNKVFRAYWDNSFHNAGARLVGVDFFSEENCYDAEDRAEIEALVVGATWYAPDYGTHHTVTRVK